jgi:hypothetical protein
MVSVMGDLRQQASAAYTMGNLGLWSQLRNRPDLDEYADEEDYNSPADGAAVERSSRCVGLQCRLVRWTLAAGVVLAYVNHWPGGH